MTPTSRFALATTATMVLLPAGVRAQVVGTPPAPAPPAAVVAGIP